MNTSVNVLLIEDDEDDYVITRDLLSDIEQTEYRLDWVDSAHDALTRLRTAAARYDVCLLDYRLGGQTGLDILRELEREDISIPMILLTDSSERQLDLAAMKLGATDFLVKSEITPISLDRTIRYVCTVKREAQRKLELALAQEARRQAELANKSKDDFIAMVSHELLGPVNAMMMWTELLKNPELKPELAAKAVSTLERLARQQVRILNDLQDYTRGVNGIIHLKRTLVELDTLLTDTINNLIPSAQNKSITVAVRALPSRLIVDGDADRLHQIFGNILNNSIKFTPTGGRIDIAAQKISAGQSLSVDVSIKDTGIGIAADFLPHIFRRYMQGGDNRKLHGGLGLGLAIVRQLVDLHGGFIKAESAGENQGTAITVTLPLHPSCSDS